MGKWKAVKEKDNWGRPYWNVIDSEGGRIVVFNTYKHEALQIASDHNTIPSLVWLAKDFQIIARDVLNSDEKEYWLPRIEAVLAQAEGRE